MRVVLVSSLLVMLACGGSNKPPESPAETPAPEPSASADTAASADSDAAAPAAAAEGAADEKAEKPEAPAPAGPNITGAIDGKPFVPKGALITKPAQKDGRILITLGEHAACGGGDPSPGEGMLTLVVPWEDGYKQDLGSLKRGGKKGGGDISFVRVGAGGKKDASATFKPTGRLTVVSAPSDQNAVGKLNVDLQSGDYMLSGDLDVQLCVAAKGAAKPAAAPAKKKKK